MRCVSRRVSSHSLTLDRRLTSAVSRFVFDSSTARSRVSRCPSSVRRVRLPTVRAHELTIACADLLLSLYFAHFHPLIPFLHLPSFNPKKTLGQLLLILLGIGAIYAPIAGALQLGRVLVEVARRGIERLINRDNRLARSLPIVRRPLPHRSSATLHKCTHPSFVPQAQAQMLWAVLRWTGSGRSVALSRVTRFRA